jgi:hypothetical protein
MTKEERERRMILENQAAIMTALITLSEAIVTTRNVTRITSDLYYHAAKTTAYIGPRE